VTRPEQHITDSKAGAIFRGAFPEWAVNGSQCDYGWDYVVEVFRNNESTGFFSVSSSKVRDIQSTPTARSYRKLWNKMPQTI
jgi:hypothetical protein